MNHRSSERAPKQRNGGHAGHSWLMVACCIPMLMIVVALVATGVVGAGFIIYALVCTAMMAVMMLGMVHGDGGAEDRRDAGHDE